MRKILFFDLDGTLWDKNERIPDSAIESLKKARKNGHKIYINTGRTRSFIRSDIVFDLGLDGIVSGCGTFIEVRNHDRDSVMKNFEENRIMVNQIIEEKLMKKTVAILKEHQFSSVLEGPEYMYTDLDDFPNDPYIDYIQKVMGSHLLSITGNESKWKFSKFSCDMRRSESEQKERGIRLLLENYEEVKHTNHISEFVPKGFSKATGVLKVCEIEGCSISESVAFGDAANDIPMILTAGTGVVMGNGTHEARQKADFVTASIENDGIAAALSRLGLI